MTALRVVDDADDFDPDYIAAADDPFLVGDDGWDHEPPAPESHDEDDEPGKKKSVATQLVELAETRFTLAVSTDGNPVALDPTGPNVAHPLRGGRLGLRASLAAAYMETTGKAAAAGALADALLVIEGRCQQADPIDVHQRVGPVPGGVVIDLGTPDGRAITVTGDGWQVVERSPIVFARTDLTGELSEPVRGDIDIMDLSIGNVTAESWPLVVGWLVAGLLPAIPHTIALMRGEQGTGKTTMATRLVDLIDPSAAPVRSVPRDVEQWIIAAAGSWLVALDNLTTVPGWLSDALCRAVTGEGMVRRRLYSDGDLAVVRFRRVVLLTAIDGGALRGDLADRVLPIDLERIATTARRTDAAMSAQWQKDRPVVFGALLDLLVDVLGALPGIQLDELPRMADYAKVLSAIDKVRPVGRSGRSSALNHYLDTTREMQGDVVADDPVAAAIVALMERQTSWTGTAADLLEALEVPDPRPRSWPTSARATSGRVRTITPALRAVDIDVDHDREPDRKRRRLIILTRQQETVRIRPSTPSTPSDVPSDLALSMDDPSDDPTSPVLQPSTPSTHRPHKTAGHPRSDGSDGQLQVPSSVDLNPGVDVDRY